MVSPTAATPQEHEVSFARDLGLFDATMTVQRYEVPFKSLVKRIMG